MTTLTVASLSSGYGGLEMALSLWLGESASRVLWHAEVDPDASRVLKEWWPDVPNLGDFTAPGFWESAPRAQAHVGGIPCQPFSAAGRQRGEDDHRHLWPFWREGIALHRPASVVFENVANLTRGKMRAIFDGIVQDLVDLGYDVRWCLLGACAVGAAHHRHRVFLLACRTRTTAHARQVEVQTCGQKLAAYVPTPVVTDARGARNSTAGRSPGKTASSGTTLTDFITLLPTTAGRDGSTRGEGSVDFWERRREQGGTRAVAGVTLGAAVTLLPSPQARDGRPGPGSSGPEHSEQRLQAGRRNLEDGVMARWGAYAEAIARHEAVLGRPAPDPTELGPKGGRRLTAAFSEWLMMLPAGHLTSVLDRNPALARAGNGVVPLQAATALRLLFSDLVHRG